MVEAMQIDTIICPESIEEKLARKHHVSMREMRQALLNNPHFRFAEKGHSQGEDVYAAFSQTFGGRYLAIFFVFKPSENTAIIISARDMSQKERKSYGRK
jgi:uncharacterized DUF497 family protein